MPAMVVFPLRLPPALVQAINRESGKRRMKPADLVRVFIEQGLGACVDGKPLSLGGGAAPPNAVTAEALEALFFCRAAMESFIPPERKEAITQRFDNAAKEKTLRLLGSKASGVTDRSAD